MTIWLCPCQCVAYMTVTALLAENFWRRKITDSRIQDGKKQSQEAKTLVVVD